MNTEAHLAMDIHSQLCASTKAPYSANTHVMLDRFMWLQGIVPSLTERTAAEQRNAVFSLIEEEHQIQCEAQTIFVSKDIYDEVADAAQTMPDNVLLPQDVFVPKGMLVFEKPFLYKLIVNDGTNDSILEQWLVKAIMFNVAESVDYSLYRADNETHNGVHIRVYGNWVSTTDNNKNETLIYNEETECAELHKNGLTYEDVTTDLLKSLGETQTAIENLDILLAKAIGAPTTLIDQTFFRFSYGTSDYDETIAGLKRTLIALFRLTYSYLAQIQEEAPRHVIKRAKRANRKIPENGYLTVLKLRRTEYENQGGTHSSPKYAFRVRGHWKRAYLRSTGLPVGDPNAYRYVYVSDYIKGKTANKEMRESTRVINIIN